MTLSRKKTITMMLAFLLFLAGVPISPVSAAVSDQPALPDGEYAVPFRYLKDGTTTVSAANQYMVKDTGKLIVTNGKASLEHEVEKRYYSTYEYLGARKPGAAKAIITTVGEQETASSLDGYTPVVVRDAANPNHVIIRMEIGDIRNKQDVLMHIHDKENTFGLPIKYNHWYNVQLEIQTNGIDIPSQPGNGGGDNGSTTVTAVTAEMYNERLAFGNNLYNTTSEGESDGTYRIGSRAELRNKIMAAESLVADSPANSALLQSAYNIINEAIKKYESLIIRVNKFNLERWIADANQWLKTAKDAGTAESGAPADPVIGAAISDGEYPVDTSTGTIVGLAQKVRDSVAAAQSVVDNPLATQAQVDTLYNTVYYTYNWDEIAKKQFHASTVKIYVLDSMKPGTVTKSVYADEIGDTAVLLKQNGYYDAFANITFIDNQNDNIVFGETTIQRPSPNVNTGLFNRSYNSTPAKLVKQSSSGDRYVYQVPIKANNSSYPQTDMVWQGLTKLKYPMKFENNIVTPIDGVEPREVFISFNASQLEALNALIKEAQNLHDRAVEGSESGQYSASSRTALQAAINKAGETGVWLAAPRPQILKATADLQTAINSFKKTAVLSLYFSAAHAKTSTFSTMESYLQKPAWVVDNPDGSYQVTLTINNSNSVPAFKIRHGEDLLEATTVSEDATTQTRVVSFKLTSLSTLADAQIRTVVPAQKYDRTHSIRLNFNNINNSSLFLLIQEAATTEGKAVTGTNPGQYPASAKTTLQAAIQSAQAEAVRVDAKQEDTNAAITVLQQALDTFRAAVIKTTAPGNSGKGNVSVYPADGNYFIPFRILKDGSDSISMANDYVVSPALLKVAGSSRTVSFTVKQSFEIKSLTISGSSGNIISQNQANNTRVVSYTLPSLTGKLNGTVRIDWDKYNYHKNYNIQFAFDESSVTSAGNPSSVPVSEHNGNVGIDGDKWRVREVQHENKEPVSKKPENEDKENIQKGDAGTDQPAVAFTNTKGHWAAEHINQAVKLGIVNGFEDGSIRPEQKVTRGEFTAIIARALKLKGDTDASVFKDVKLIPSWAREYAALAASAGFIGGYDDGTFRAEVELSRLQLTVILARAAKLNLKDDTPLPFSDADQIPAWARKEVAAAAAAGLIQGKGNNMFAPNDTATQAQALTVALRLLELLNG